VSGEIYVARWSPKARWAVVSWTLPASHEPLVITVIGLQNARVESALGKWAPWSQGTETNTPIGGQSVGPRSVRRVITPESMIVPAREIAWKVI
jgi:hypothetical protein